VGPFVSLRRRPKAVLIVAVVEYDNSYTAILEISDAMADAYVDYMILPDIHLLLPRTVELLEQDEDKRWERTKAVSIRLLRGE
jgi:hypothetical protein